MKIALAQLNPKVGDCRANLLQVLRTLDQLKEAVPDLVVFSELFLTGYPPHDLLEKKWFLEEQHRVLAELVETSRAYPGTGIVIGAVVPSTRVPGRGLYNAAMLIHQGRMVFSQAKTLLPTYDVFDEARYFDSAEEIRTVPFKDQVLGLCVCEDAWNEPSLWPRQIYAIDPVTHLADQQATLIINISASPFYAGKDQIRYHLLQNHASRLRRPFIFVNQVGGNDEIVFDGHSLALDREGRPLAVLPGFQEKIVIAETDQIGVPDLFQPQDKVEAVFQALTLGIRDYLHKSGFSQAVVGLSGGIDSAVTVCLAVAALGPENVFGVSMPSRFSSTGSREDARILADNLGIGLKVVPIKPLHDAYLEVLGPHFEGRPADVTEENIQARIRGNILMAFSNKFGHLVLSTGNKSEIAMGYCTLYGDMSGGLAVLSDVPKMMVYDLARYINRDREIIPQASLEKAPSAELRPDQKDEDSLPPYVVLDQILQLYIEEGLSPGEIVDRGFAPDMVTWIIKTVNRNEYKRKQAPPGLKVTTKAFGIGRRMPIVAKHDF